MVTNIEKNYSYIVYILSYMTIFLLWPATLFVRVLPRYLSRCPCPDAPALTTVKTRPLATLQPRAALLSLATTVQNSVQERVQIIVCDLPNYLSAFCLAICPFFCHDSCHVYICE
jgi:hypothetical protein